MFLVMELTFVYVSFDIAVKIWKRGIVSIQELMQALVIQHSSYIYKLANSSEGSRFALDPVGSLVTSRLAHYAHTLDLFAKDSFHLQLQPKYQLFYIFYIQFISEKNLTKYNSINNTLFSFGISLILLLVRSLIWRLTKVWLIKV